MSRKSISEMTEMTINTREKSNSVAKQFVMRWGELGTKWGINRTMAQIHALLYISPEPLNAEQISETLFISRSNVSTSLRELQSWRLVKVVHVNNEDRRDFFQSAGDVWQLFWIILEERKKREIDPVVEALTSCLSEYENGSDQYMLDRLLELRRFLVHMNELYEEIKKAPMNRLVDFMDSADKVKELFDDDSGPIKITVQESPEPISERTEIKISEVQESAVTESEPETVFYDASCMACSRFAKRLEPVLSSKGVRFAPLQEPSAIERLQLSDQERLSRLWVLKDGRKIGGGDALIYLAGKLPLGRPFAYLGEFYWFRRLFSKTYKHFAKHRHVIGEFSGRFF